MVGMTTGIDPWIIEVAREGSPYEPTRKDVRVLLNITRQQAEQIAGLRSSLGKIASALIERLVEETFDDGTQILEVVLAQNPKLRADLARALGATDA